MIEIRKGNHSLNVSMKTYESMFKRMGYHIVGEEAELKASSANKNVLAPKNNKKEDIKVQENNEDGLKGVFPKKTNNMSNEEEKNKKNQSEAKTNNPDEGDNKLEDILGIISNNKKTSEGSKTKKED